MRQENLHRPATLPESNIDPKNGGKMILSFWGPAYIPVPAVGFREASSNNTSSYTLYKL